MTAQREAILREIAELRETREQFLEETTSLAAKNDELAELNAQLARQADTFQDNLARQRAPTIFSKGARTHPSGSPSLSSLTTSATLPEVPEETAKVIKVTKVASVSKPQPPIEPVQRRFKWYKGSKGPGPDSSNSSASISRPLGWASDKSNMNRNRPPTEVGREHVFQQHNSMRFAKCELCQDKMWGLAELRCTCE